jgi:hypothetical protein
MRATSLRRTEAPFGSVRSRLELLRRAEAPLRRHGGRGGLLVHRRPCADGAGGELRVLGLHGRQHRRRGQVVGLELVGIEPDAHGVLGAELHRRTDSGDALDGIEHARGHDVVELLGARAARRRHQADAAEEPGGDLGDADSLLVHLRRQTRLSERYAVLRLYGRNVRVGAVLERQRDGGGAVGGGLRGEVEEVVDAGELLLDHLCNGRLHRRGVRARVRGSDRDLRWRDGRIGLARQPQQREQAAERDEDRQHPCKHRAIDEEMRHED